MFRYMFDVTEIMGPNDLYGFIDPQLTHEGNKFDDIQTYVTKCFQRGKEIYCVLCGFPKGEPCCVVLLFAPPSPQPS